MSLGRFATLEPLEEPFGAFWRGRLGELLLSRLATRNVINNTYQ